MMLENKGFVSLIFQMGLHTRNVNENLMMLNTTMGHLSMKPGRPPNLFLDFHPMKCVQET